MNFSSWTTSDAEIADLVNEAIVENADLKRKLYGRLEPQMKASSILASNTSTIPITRLADGLLIVISIPTTL